RAGQLDRTVLCNDDACSLREIADDIVPKLELDAELSERKYSKKTALGKRIRHPERNARRARLAVGSKRVKLPKTQYSDRKSEPFEVNVVRVWEPHPPRGERSVEWILITSEDCSSKAALARVVEIYRKRWVIEEFFRALKSGCALEERQVESHDALCKVMALFIPIAYRLLLLRGLERLDARLPASRIFSEAELQLMTKAPSNRRLP